MLPKAFLHSIFQAIDGESLFNEFVGKYFYSLFEIICLLHTRAYLITCDV